MKHCPTCNRTYADETLTYCLADGSLLSAPYDPGATQPFPPPRITNPPPTEVFHSNQTHSEQGRRARHPALAYIIVALLALIVGGGVVLLLKSKDRDTPLAQSSNSLTTASPVTATTNREQVNVKEEPRIEPTPDASSPVLTIDAVNSLINRWVSAQNVKDLAAYQSCYGASFAGVKRTASGRSYYYDFNAWMKDRKRMISEAVGLNVEVKNMQVSIEGDVATVEFDQYYHSRQYSDWGPKRMKVKLTPAGEKIVYEELKASYPL